MMSGQPTIDESRYVCKKVQHICELVETRIWFSLDFSAIFVKMFLRPIGGTGSTPRAGLTGDVTVVI